MLPELKTERLSIRMLSADDLRACYELKAEIGWLDAAKSEEHNLEQCQLWLDWTIRNYRELAALYQPPYGERAIVEQQSGRLVGMVGLVPLLAPFGRLPSFGGDPSAHFTAEVGLFWALRPAAQGKGYATEGARALIDFAFDSMQLQRILANTEYDNARSAAVMQRLGMRIERNPSADPHWFQITGSLTRPPDARQG